MAFTHLVGVSGPRPRPQVVQGPTAVAEGREGVREALFPVLVDGTGADGLLDGTGGAGPVADRADLLLVALVRVVPALDRLKLAGAGQAGESASIGRLPLGGPGMRAGAAVAAMKGLQAVQDQR